MYSIWILLGISGLGCIPNPCMKQSKGRRGPWGAMGKKGKKKLDGDQDGVEPQPTGPASNYPSSSLTTDGVTKVNEDKEEAEGHASSSVSPSLSVEQDLTDATAKLELASPDVQYTQAEWARYMYAYRDHEENAKKVCVDFL